MLGLRCTPVVVTGGGGGDGWIAVLTPTLPCLSGAATHCTRSDWRRVDALWSTCSQRAVNASCSFCDVAYPRLGLCCCTGSALRLRCNIMVGAIVCIGLSYSTRKVIIVILDRAPRTTHNTRVWTIHSTHVTTPSPSIAAASMVHVSLPCRCTRWAPSQTPRCSRPRTTLQCRPHTQRLAQQLHCKPPGEGDHAPSTSTPTTGDNTIADIEQVAGVRVIVDNSGNARAEYLVRWKVRALQRRYRAPLLITGRAPRHVGTAVGHLRQRAPRL